MMENNVWFKLAMLHLDRCPSRSSILEPLFFLNYINDLPDTLTSNPKMFANDTSLFSTVTEANATANPINNDLDNLNR